jgi:hypothetical protein
LGKVSGLKSFNELSTTKKTCIKENLHKLLEITPTVAEIGQQ